VAKHRSRTRLLRRLRAQMVNGGFPHARPLWFRIGGYGTRPRVAPQLRVNRKFTANQINRIFNDFSAN
jgi:hypothetical protein